MAQSAGAAEYSDCFLAKGLDSPNKCLVFDTKHSDGEAPVMLELYGMKIPLNCLQ